MQHTTDKGDGHEALSLVCAHIDAGFRQERADELRTRTTDPECELLLPQIIDGVQLPQKGEVDFVVQHSAIAITSVPAMVRIAHAKARLRCYAQEKVVDEISDRGA